jgi:hypothetical protein
MRLDAKTVAKAASAALHVFGRQHPLTVALYMAVADPDDLEDVHAALADLPREHYKLFAAAFYREMMPGRW